MNKQAGHLTMLSKLTLGVSKFTNLVLRLSRQFSFFIRKFRAARFGTQVSDTSFQKSLLSKNARNVDFLTSVKEQRSRLFFIHPEHKEETVAALLQICPQAKSLIIQAAETICEHYFDLLGSGSTALGWPIDWHTDFKSGFRWNPAQYYSDIRPAPYPGGYDLKVPWELSRCQHFVWLGQAYWLTSDEKYTREFRAQVEDWIRQNSPEYGVNWACSMDIAIRAVNWLWGYAFFRSSPLLDDEFHLAFYKSLLSHGRHVRANLEGTATFRGNHYLADIVGLIYLGILIPELKEARAWREFGLRELEREMFMQVYPDGGNFEASTSYHRLATELFLSATLLARLNGHDFSEPYMRRLEQMLELVFHITRPDGTVPMLGDQDNGRLHRLKVWSDPDQEWQDFRPLLAIGCVAFDRPAWGKFAIDHWEEAIWFFGKNAVDAFQHVSQYALPEANSVAFRDTGIYIMRTEDTHVAVDIGPIGQNGKGGHAHNDSLSFELFSSGQVWIQDPGTYVYTLDYDARNLFRSTAFHNTLTLPGYEQNGYAAHGLFSMKRESESRVLSWSSKPGASLWLEGEVRRITNPKVVHRRSFRLDREHRALLLIDRVQRAGSPGQLAFHFAPGIELEKIAEPYPGVRMHHPDGQIALLFSLRASKANIELSEGWLSESYGTRVPSKIAFLQLESDREQRTIILLPGHPDISRRIEGVIKDEDNSH